MNLGSMSLCNLFAPVRVLMFCIIVSSLSYLPCSLVDTHLTTTLIGFQMSGISALGPIDPASKEREEKSAPWVVRKLVGSMTGRIVMSSYESLRAAGTSIVCLSPWGDSSPLLLPCIRFRDLAVHTVIAATGGMAAVAAPVMGPVSDAVVSSFGDTILVEVGLHVGFDLTTNVANDLVISKPIKHMVPIHSKRLETTGIKVLLITLQHKHTVEDAALGFYRSSVHQDASLFSSVKDYLAVEKGWFSPYLFASSRRPVIPRSMKPDIIFCHGPFLAGDYRVGETLLAESASIIALCNAPLLSPETSPPTRDRHHSLSISKFPSLSNMFSRSRTPSPEPVLTSLPSPPAPRRMVILVVGLKPHRRMWTTSARPGESVINYILLNGCPALVVPVKVGAPLVAWDGLTLEKLWKVELPAEGAEVSVSGKYEGIVSVLFEYLDLCVDWERIVVQAEEKDDVTEPTKEVTITGGGESGKTALKDALRLLVASAIRSGKSNAVTEDVDEDRSGIAMWRIP